MEENNEHIEGSKVKHTKRLELNFWKSCILNALGLLIASATTSTISFSNIFYFIALVILIWFMNWILKPILIVFALPLIIFTMGIGILFINAFIIYMAASVFPEGIEVSSYWAALWASFLVSVLWWSLEMFRSERIVVFKEKVYRFKEEKKDDNNDVIDV